MRSLLKQTARTGSAALGLGLVIGLSAGRAHAQSSDETVMALRHIVPQATAETSPVEVGSDGTIDVQTDAYRVTGRSYKDLWASIQRATLENGNMGVGDATISFQPRATYVEAGGSCTAVDPAVDLTAVLTFPQWDSPSNDQRAVAAFKRTLDYLRVHEAQHVLIARRYRKTMVEAISELPPQPNCQKLRASVAAAAAKVNDRHVAAQRAYDAKERKHSAELFSRTQ